MKDLENLLKVISEGMRTLAGGVTSLAEKVDDIATNQAQQKKASPSPPPGPGAAAGKSAQGKKPAAAKSAPKAKSTPTAQKSSPASATTTTAVFKAIGGSKKGVDTASIRAKTNLTARQVSNAVYKLKKAGKIKSVKRGTYTKA